MAADLEESDVFESYIRNQDAKSTLASNKFALSAIKRYFETIAERRVIHSIPPLELDGLLARFFMESMKRNGDPYEPDCLSTIHRSFKRHLESKGYRHDILRDDNFKTSRKVLAARRKELRKQGLGGKPKAARELTNDEEEMMFSRNYFATNDAAALQRGLWYMIAMNCGFRGNDESKKLRWGDIVSVEESSTERGHLIWMKERGTKTRDGRESETARQIRGTLYATGGNRCPLEWYKLFSTRRPDAMKADESPFFLGIDHGKNTTDKIWYTCKPMGINSLSKILSNAKKLFKFPGNVSNHSVRKTGIGRLLDANIPEIYVAQHSGMKNTDSLKSYKSANKDCQMKMSDILNNNLDPGLQSVSTGCTDKRIAIDCESTRNSSVMEICGFRPVFQECQVTINIDNSNNNNGTNRRSGTNLFADNIETVDWLGQIDFL